MSISRLDTAATNVSKQTNYTDLFSEMMQCCEKAQEIEDFELDLQVTSEQVLQSKKKLTIHNLLHLAQESQIENINQLFLSNMELCVFESCNDFDIQQLRKLEFLSLSKNKLLNLFGVGQITSLVELNINFNYIDELLPIQNCIYLKKLWANNNQIKTISYIKKLVNLEVLDLYNNKVKNLNETIDILKGFKKLKELDLEKNTCCRVFNYKYDILMNLKLKKFDGEEVNENDLEMNQKLNNQFDNYQKKNERPQTSCGFSTVKQEETQNLQIQQLQNQIDSEIQIKKELQTNLKKCILAIDEQNSEINEIKEEIENNNQNLNLSKALYQDIQLQQKKINMIDKEQIKKIQIIKQKQEYEDKIQKILILIKSKQQDLDAETLKPIKINQQKKTVIGFNRVQEKLNEIKEGSNNNNEINIKETQESIIKKPIQFKFAKKTQI